MLDGPAQSLFILQVIFFTGLLQPEDLANNAFYDATPLRPLPWHAGDEGARGIGEPEFQLHKSVLDALAPAMPLKAVFSGQRRA